MFISFCFRLTFIKMFKLKGIMRTVKMLEKCRRAYSVGCGSGTFAPPNKMSVLPNGMRVATEETDSLLACVALFVEVGPGNEKPANHGITHFIEHMAYRGFKSLGKQQLEDCLADMGAKLSVVTTREFQVFYGQCLSENAADIVAILSKIITDLELSEAEMEMAKSMIDLESLDVDRNPKTVVSDYLHETAFQCTPLSRRLIGPSRNLKKFCKNDIDCYMNENYYPTRLVLATSGAVSHENNVSYAQSCFGNLTQTCDVSYVAPQRFTGSQILYRDDSMKFVHAAIAVEAPGMKSSDYIPMLLASNIIGSWNKSQGGNDRHGAPLARAAATSNLCETFESFYIAYRDVGLWGIYIVSDKMDIDDMVINAQDRWMHLCTTTTANDFERGLNTTKLELAKKMEGSVKSCMDIGMKILYNCERTRLPQMFLELSKANEKVIKKVANDYLYDKCPAVSAVGPIEVLSDYTRIRAGMYWLRL